MPIFLHTRLRVSDLNRSVAWYEQLGFRCTSRSAKSPAGNQLAFLEIAGSQHFLELCYSPEYQLKVPEDLLHTAVGYADLYAVAETTLNQTGRAVEVVILLLGTYLVLDLLISALMNALNQLVRIQER